MRIHLISRF